MSDPLIVVGDADGILTRQACEIASLLDQPYKIAQHPDPSASKTFVAIDDFQERAEVVGSIPRGSLTNLIHPTAFVSPQAELGLNVIVGAQAIVAMNAQVADGVIANALSSIEHDNVIGAFSFLGTGAICCGHVTTGEFVFIGGGAVVQPRIQIGSHTTIGTGAVVVKDAEPNSVYIGNPAKLKS